MLKGCDNVTLTADGQAGMSTLAADPADSAAITFGDTVSTSNLVIAGDGGYVSFNGKADNIEITASNRVIDLSGMDATSLTVTGRGNPINLGGSVGAVSIEGQREEYPPFGQQHGRFPARGRLRLDHRRHRQGKFARAARGRLRRYACLRQQGR